MGLVASLLMLTACSSGMHTQVAQTFTAGPGRNQVTLGLVVDYPQAPVSAAVLEETETKVVVRVEVGDVDPGGGSVTGVGTDVSIVVDLAGPLGERTVVNENGLSVVPQEVVAD